MEFIGKRCHKKAVREWGSAEEAGCVRSRGRTTRSQKSRFFCSAEKLLSHNYVGDASTLGTFNCSVMNRKLAN